MRHAMICAPQPEAAEAGADVLRAGGNAVDAAIACALVQGVVDPLMAGIAGFGSMGIYMPARDFHGYIDFHAPAPGASRPDMWEDLILSEARDGYGFILRGNVNDVGYQSVCVPASLAAYYEAQREFGVLPWSEIVHPAIAWAESGWIVRPHVEFFWSDAGTMGRVPNPDRLRHTPPARALYCREDGSPKRVGDLVRNRDYAAVLRLIARDGAAAFYQGELARTIAEDFRGHSGLLTLEDLRDYAPKRVAPLWGDYHGWRIATNPPPGGGVLLIQMLNIVEAFDLTRLGHNSAEYIRVVAEVMKRATIDKDRHVGDPGFVDVPIGRLVDKNYAADLAGAVKHHEKADVPRFNTGWPSKDTTHVSVIDRNGACVSMTHSLGMPSGVITPGLGFMYNGCMGVFDPRPGRAGSIAPGKARVSSICPSILFRGETPGLVIGAPGATQIAMGVLQAILNVIDFGMGMTEAVSAARFSATSNVIDVSNRIPRFVTRRLEAQGYEVMRSPFTFGFAAVHGIRIEGEVLDGAADPGHDGVAIAV
jgi:gamma-glutamyltranspeptidase/glutathione hydrolase